MDLPFGSDITKQFVTNIGLITTNGTYSNDIMACEWTQQVSYSPGLIAISVSPNHATHKNIEDTKEFGVNIASKEQAVMASIAGNYSGKHVDKIKLLEELGFKFYNAKKLNLLMVKDAAVCIECKLFKEVRLGDHTMFVGEAVDAYANDKIPLAYHKGRYGEVSFIPKPTEEELAKIESLVKKYTKV
ncbi:MAG: flavin reductase [Candidatus Nitrosothermus koennekii]|nr:MAG: flavin reductase [Candidatus Nitrosothermus koennekii]